MQKLGLLLPKGELSAEQVNDAVANVARYDAKDGATALLAGDAARYVRVLDGLRGEGESTVLILWMLAEELRALARIQLGVEAKRLPRAALERALAHAARIDRATKGVGPGEPWDELVRLGLELLNESEVARAGSRKGG